MRNLRHQHARAGRGARAHIASLCALLWGAASVATAQAPPCLTAGASLTIRVDNRTGSPQPVTVSGALVAAACTGGAGLANFTQAATCAPGASDCLTLSGLQPGIWRHSFRAGAQQQYQKSLLIAADPSGAANVLSWTAFATVLTIDRTDDNDAPPVPQCPSAPGTHTCTLRQALLAGAAAAPPLLVQFDPSVFPAGRPTTVQLTQSASLSIAGAGMTIDGTDPDGDPTLPGDPYGRIIELPGTGATMVFSNQQQRLVGLFIQRPTLADGAAPGDVVRFDGSAGPAEQDLVSHCKIDGGGGSLTTKSTGHDCVSGVAGAGTDWANADAVLETEITACPDKGVKATTLAYVKAAGCWVHHNIGGGLQATLSGNIEADENLVENNGYNATVQVFLDANGIAANGANTSVAPVTADVPAILHTNANIVRNNSAHAISVRELSVATIANDLACGSLNSGAAGQNGIAVFNTDTPTGATATIRGTAAVYNGRSGAAVANGSFADLGSGSDPGNNAFTANAATAGLGGHAVDNATTAQAEIPAVADQWTGCASSTAACTPDTSGAVGTQPDQPYQATAQTLALHIDTFSPMKAVAGQLVRISGGGFDAIDGYPPGGDCTHTIATSNSCSPMHGDCVQYASASGQWTDLPVESVTPTEIVVRLPATVTCAQPAAVRVIRLDATGGAVTALGTFCTNAPPPPTPPAAPDDAGFVPPDRTTLQCALTAAQNLAAYSACLAACQIQAVSATFRGGPFDVGACESGPTRSCRSRYAAATAKLTARGICPPCLDATQQNSLADAAATSAGTLASDLYCAGTAPLAGLIQAFVPPDQNTLACERGTARAVRTLASCVAACHRKAASSAFQGKSFDEDACERTDPVRSCRARYDAAAALATGSGCPACLDPTGQARVADAVTSIANGSTAAVYCAGSLPLP